MVMIVGFVFGLPFFWLVSLLKNRDIIHRRGPEGELGLVAQVSCVTRLLTCTDDLNSVVAPDSMLQMILHASMIVRSPLVW